MNDTQQRPTFRSAFASMAGGFVAVTPRKDRKAEQADAGAATKPAADERPILADLAFAR